MDNGWLDWTLWAVLAFSVVLGALRGLVREVISLAAWVLAFVWAQVHAETVAAWLPAGLTVPTPRPTTQRWPGRRSRWSIGSALPSVTVRTPTGGVSLVK
jgi:hypothetical protein